MTTTEYLIWIVACIIGGGFLLILIIGLPFHIHSERIRKQKEFLSKKDSYSLNPLGLTIDSTQFLRDCLANALKSCKEGELTAAVYHVQNAWTVMPSEFQATMGPVSPSVKSMKVKERWKEFCSMLKLASKLPQNENPQKLMENWLQNAIQLCDSRIKDKQQKTMNE